MSCIWKVKLLVIFSLFFFFVLFSKFPFLSHMHGPEKQDSPVLNPSL